MTGVIMRSQMTPGFSLRSHIASVSSELREIQRDMPVEWEQIIFCNPMPFDWTNMVVTTSVA
jgi:hypothetical protein